MAGIFLSYRRSDSEDKTARIADRLIPEFGKNRIFFDKDSHSLVSGAEFGQVIDQRVADADVVVAIIGDGWLVTNDDTKRARLHDEGDFVARELTGAIDAGKPIIPVLLDRDRLPAPDELPDRLRGVLDHQAAMVRTGTPFSRDVDDLVHALRNYVQDDRSRTRRFFDRNRRRIVLAASSVFVIGVIGFGILLWRSVPAPEPPEQMDGPFNVAVAELATDQLDDVTGSEAVGMSAAAAVADAIGASAAPDDTMVVWGPRKVGPVRGTNGEGNSRPEALDRAAQLNADVLVYGTARPGEGGRASVELGMVIRGADERRPADPLVLEKAFGLAGEVDIRRLDTAEDALASLPVLRFFGPLVRSVHLLDRDEAASAVAVLEQARSAAESLDTSSPSTAQIIAVMDGLLGVAFSRQAEANVEGSLDAAIGAFQRALGTDPSFTFAELGLLGAEYLRATGPTGALDTISPDQITVLKALRDRYVRLRDTEAATGTKSVTWAQASNVIGQIDLLLFEAGGATDVRLRASAVESFTTVDAAYTNAPEPSPELELLANVARADLAYAAAATNDFDEALRWYRAAHDIATPYWYAVQSGLIGVVELELGNPCEASRDLERALNARTEAGNFISGTDRDNLTSFLSQARAQCDSSESTS